MELGNQVDRIPRSTDSVSVHCPHEPQTNRCDLLSCPSHRHGRLVGAARGIPAECEVVSAERLAGRNVAVVLARGFRFDCFRFERGSDRGLAVS